VARRWLGALAGHPATAAGVLRGTAIAPADAAGRARIAALRRWADGVDPSAWRATVSAPAALVGGDDGSWLADGSLVVTLVSAKQRTTRTRIAVVIELTAPVPGGGTWRIRDVQVDSPRTGLRAFADPTIVRRTAVDAILPASLAANAAVIADLAQRSFTSLQRQLGARASVDAIALRGWDDESQLRAALGVRRIASIDLDAPPLAAVDGDGDLIVHAPSWRGATPARRAGAIRSAMFRTLTRASLASLPRIVVEGVAMALAAPPTRDELGMVGSTEGRGIERLLLADSAVQLDGPAETARAHALGTWLLEQRSLAALDELATLYAAGIDADHAVRRVLHATPAGVAAQVSSAASASLAPGSDHPDDEGTGE
jgi:hypothetical protein